MDYETYRNLANDRDTDVLLTVKYHYKGELPPDSTDYARIELLRCVFAIHNGVAPTAVTDSDMIQMLTSDEFCRKMFSNPRKIALFFNDLCREFFWERGGNVTPIRIILRAIIGKLGMTTVEELGMKLGDTLPPVCPVMQTALDEYFAEKYAKKKVPNV